MNNPDDNSEKRAHGAFKAGPGAESTEEIQERKLLEAVKLLDEYVKEKNGKVDRGVERSRFLNLLPLPTPRISKADTATMTEDSNGENSSQNRRVAVTGGNSGESSIQTEMTQSTVVQATRLAGSGRRMSDDHASASQVLAYRPKTTEDSRTESNAQTRAQKPSTNKKTSTGKGSNTLHQPAQVDGEAKSAGGSNSQSNSVYAASPSRKDSNSNPPKNYVLRTLY